MLHAPVCDQQLLRTVFTVFAQEHAVSGGVKVEDPFR